jgi:phosphate acetyltransferase
MSNNLFITATEARSGKSAISLGVMEMLQRKIDLVGFFRPIINVEPGSQQEDNDIKLISKYFNLGLPYEQMYGFTLAEAKRLVSAGKESEVIEGIISKYSLLAEKFDFILCEGTDFAGSSDLFEFDINAQVSRHLACPVLLVANAHKRTVEDTIRSIELAFDSLCEHGCQILATIVNRVTPGQGKHFLDLLADSQVTKDQLFYTIPNVAALGNPTVGEIAEALGGQVLYGKQQLNRHVHGFTVAAMQLSNFLTRLEHGSLIITAGDRADVIVGCLAAVSSQSMDNVAGIVLTGGLLPGVQIDKLIQGFPRMVPIISVAEDTFPTATLAHRVHASISPDNGRKITQVLAVFEKNIDVAEFAEKVITSTSSILTPKMFEYELIQRARTDKKHIVLPEGSEDRILSAAEILLDREVADITLLGNQPKVRARIAQMGLHLEAASIINPQDSDYLEDFTNTYHKLRQHKGITKEAAHDFMLDANFFGTMMILKGHADGMVSGAVHTTRDTIRPAFEIIKPRPGFTNISSVFFMCMPNRVLVYGDCAINTNPTAEQLAEIAITSAQTAKDFGIDPIVALLSYSSGESGQGEDVVKVRQATQLAKEIAAQSWPDLKIEGPIQYDAAVDPAVARTKLPDSQVAGQATVFIFPDLNTGNNTYKAVQRSAGVVAIGPVLQGLKRPVNDLSRGCTITDIVNTVAITAIQAQADLP